MLRCCCLSDCSLFNGGGRRTENCTLHGHPNLAVMSNICGSDPSALLFFLLENGDNYASTVTFMAEKQRTCVKCRVGLLCIIFTQERIPKREEETPREYIAWISNELISLIASWLNISNKMRFSDKYALPEEVKNQGNWWISFLRALCTRCAFLLHAGSHSPFLCPADNKRQCR